MNAFLDYAEKQTPAAVKRARAAETRHIKAAETRRSKAAEKELVENEIMFRLWKKGRKERLDALLAGPHGAAAGELVAFLKKMSLTDGTDLIKLVTTAGWKQTDDDTRFEVLSLIDLTLTALRERAGLEPINDTLPGEPPSTFLILREMLR